MRTFIALFCLLSFHAMAKVTVVTSIAPIQQITAAIMQGVDEPKLLIRHQVSAHHFSFKPSHFKLINQADLMIWISRDFESGFQRLPDILPGKTRRLELTSALDLHNQDGHIWYSPVLLPQIINQITQQLSDIDPTYAAIYRSNADKLINSIKIWETYTRAIIAKSKPKYVLDHDFLSHFERDMGIRADAVLHDGHDQHSSIHEIREIEQSLRKSSVKCLLINEPSSSKLARNFANEFGLKIHNIMLAGEDSQQSPALLDSLNRLSSILQNCH